MTIEPDPFDALDEKPILAPADDLDALLGEHLPNALDRMLDHSEEVGVSGDEVDLESLLGPDAPAPARPVVPPKPSHDLLAGIDDLLGPPAAYSAISAAASSGPPSHDELLSGLDEFLPEVSEAATGAALTPPSGSRDPFTSNDDSDDLLAGLESLGHPTLEAEVPLPESLMRSGAPERDELADLLGPAPSPGGRTLMVAPVKGKKERERPVAGGLLIGRSGIERVRIGEYVSPRRQLTNTLTLRIHLFWDGPLGYRGREKDKPRIAAVTIARAFVVLVIVGFFWKVSVALPPGNLFASVAPASVALAAAEIPARPPVEFLPPNKPVGVGSLQYLDAAAATVAWRGTAAAIKAAIGGDASAIDKAAAAGNLTPQLATSLAALIGGLNACPGAFGSAQACSLRLVPGPGDPTAPGNVIFFSVDRYGGTDRISALDGKAGLIEQVAADGTIHTALAWSAVNVTIVKLSNGLWTVDSFVPAPLPGS